MAIPASELVRIMPRVLAGSGQDLVFNGLFLTDNYAAPANGQLLRFIDAASVGGFFGKSSREYKAAQIYFNGYNNSLTKASELLVTFAQRSSKKLQLRGANIENQRAVLGEINAAQGGSRAFELKVNDNGTARTFTLSLTGADFASLSAVLTALSTQLGALTDYPTALTFNLVVGDGMPAHVMLTAEGSTSPDTDSDSNGYDSGVEITSITGGLADLLGVSDSTRVLYQPFTAAADLDVVLGNVTTNSMNWVTFTHIDRAQIDANDTLFKGTLTLAENEKLVAWVQEQFNEGTQFLYVHWTNETALTTSSADSTITAQIRALKAEGVTHVYDNYTYAAFVMGCAAAIAWDRNNSTITLAFKQQSGLGAIITEKAKAANLINNGVNFMGDYASRNDDFILFQTGQMDGQFKWIDTYLNSTWLNNALQVQILKGFELTPRVPYTDRGYTLIRSWVQDVVNRALANGTIDTGMNLSETQKNELMLETGGIDISTELHNSGYYLQIVDATAQIRQQRESPACNFWYTYAGSIHKLNLPSTAVV